MGPTRFLIDECVSRAVAGSLRDCGESAVTMIDHFGRRGVSDEAWAPIAGRDRFVVISKDLALARKPEQVRLLVEHEVLWFAIGPDVHSPAEQVRAVLTALNDIKRICARRRARNGVIARISRGREGQHPEAC